MYKIKTAQESEIENLIALIALAFSSDPFNRWALKDPKDYITLFPFFARAFGGNAIKRSTAFYIDGYAGAALWMPPSVEPDFETLTDLVEKNIPSEIKPDLFSIFEQMGEAHPSEPCWYLPMLGVDPVRQNQGLGSALLNHGLAQIDEQGGMAYLEASSLRSVPLYERHGFKVIGEIQSGSSPIMYPMIRKP
ncbi:GNAT family N-acetyltransferase [Cytophagaceae bacterium ABcell3]|nr:GNAT family N-acetyltransferase [Cytophagaceae bacterium ABcell3]